MDYQLDNKRSHESLSCLASSTIITSFDSAYNSNFQQQKHHHNGSFISLRCRPTLTTLPPELLSKISYNLSLCDYSFLSRTCARLHSHLFHPAELVLFLKTRYRLSIQSGSIIIFAYLANMQVRAPLLLERIFEDFFADSPLRLQEEQTWKLHCQQQRQQLSNNTYQLNQAIISKGNGSASYDNSSSLEYQRMDGIEVHKAAEKARRQAKSDAVRMLGVLYALDKTHIGPSSSTNALVLIGAYDPSEPTPPAPAPAPAPALSLSTVTETKATTALDTTALSSSVVFAPSFFSVTAHATAPIPVNSSFSSFSKAITATTTADADAEDTATPTPSFMYHAAPSLLSASAGSGYNPKIKIHLTRPFSSGPPTPAAPGNYQHTERP
ncbi:hypothetical protein BGZ97_001108 [Linnemannia gamsii]|uniref:F-box domain-containing protein n=1 Tax=Linnemannia gamsii TaxID=64522 RepID=A0A9P6R121_9FUNG|nr:hypothetical protein BGZ97_001108 [Linnemannia gamsii]